MRTALSALSAVTIALAGALLAAAPTQAATATHATAADSATSTTVVIADRDRRTAAAVADDQFVRMVPRTGDDQPWVLEPAEPERGFRIVSEVAGTCMQAHPFADPTGSFVIHDECGGPRADLWEFLTSEGPGDLVTFVNVTSGLCLTHPSPLSEDRRLRLTHCEPASDDVDQVFRLLPA